MNLSGRICAMLRYRPWQYTKYSLRALPCLTQIRLGNLSQRLIGEEYDSSIFPPSTPLCQAQRTPGGFSAGRAVFVFIPR
jgi:hypothetical protein